MTRSNSNDDLSKFVLKNIMRIGESIIRGEEQAKRSEFTVLDDAVAAARSRIREMLGVDEPVEAPEPEQRVCAEHLRFAPCRKHNGGISPKTTSDPFIVEIARRYQKRELDFTLAGDEVKTGPRVPSNDELRRREQIAKDAGVSTAVDAVRRWLANHVPTPEGLGPARRAWLDRTARNFLADPEVRVHLVPADELREELEIAHRKLTGIYSRHPWLLEES